MNIEFFLENVKSAGINFFVGVPDSQLKPLCDMLMFRYGISSDHIVAANEGAAVGLAAGHYLSSGEPALVYMQNSGIGNAVNPICSLLNEKVYGIPALFVIGWRGEPGKKDEPQHIFQGEITLELLDVLGIKSFVLEPGTTEEELRNYFEEVKKLLEMGKLCAFVIKKNFFETSIKMQYENVVPMSREEVICKIADITEDGDVYVSTTGKLSRELFEAREARKQGHKFDFLTVGSMGHASMIALGIAKNKPRKKVFCLDGDGATIMHMGNLGIVGANNLENYIHVLINNGAHETVGGIPTVSNHLDYIQIARACGYRTIKQVRNEEELERILPEIHNYKGPVFVEIKTNLFSRKDLGRPTTTPQENKVAFMSYIDGE